MDDTAGRLTLCATDSELCSLIRPLGATPTKSTSGPRTATGLAYALVSAPYILAPIDGVDYLRRAGGLDVDTVLGFHCL